MPFYAKHSGSDVRVNLNSASTLYSPSDSSGDICNVGIAAEYKMPTAYYANGTQIYASHWTTIWTGSQSLTRPFKAGATADTTISSLTIPTGAIVKVECEFNGTSGWQSSYCTAYEDEAGILSGYQETSGGGIDPSQSYSFSVIVSAKTSTSITVTVTNGSSNIAPFGGMVATSISTYV